MDNLEISQQFISDWKSGKEVFEIETSGSTGPPKLITLKREWMIWSANQTGLKLNVRPTDSIFCALPLTKIGGLMMLVRAMHWNIPIEIFQPSLMPHLAVTDATITSFTPMQLNYLLKDLKMRKYLAKFRHIIIGGGTLSRNLEKELNSLASETVFWHSYGMTETYSHIALRNIKFEERFKAFDEIDIAINPINNCLMYKAPFTDTYLQTNDTIELFSDNSFLFTGRVDFVINSGGVKLFPEMIETLINEKLLPNGNICICGMSDPIFGEIVTLVHEKTDDFSGTDFKFLLEYSKYAIPKRILKLDKIPLNQSNKIDRIKLQKILKEGNE